MVLIQKHIQYNMQKNYYNELAINESNYCQYYIGQLFFFKKKTHDLP